MAGMILGVVLVALLLAVGIFFVFDFSDTQPLSERIWYRLGGLALVVGTCCMLVWQWSRP